MSLHTPVPSIALTSLSRTQRVSHELIRVVRDLSDEILSQTSGVSHELNHILSLSCELLQVSLAKVKELLFLHTFVPSIT